MHEDLQNDCYAGSPRSSSAPVCLLVQRDGVVHLPLGEKQRLCNGPLLRQQRQLRPDGDGQGLLLVLRASFGGCLHQLQHRDSTTRKHCQRSSWDAALSTMHDGK